MSSKCRVHDAVGIYALKVFLDCLSGCCYVSVLGMSVGFYYMKRNY